MAYDFEQIFKAAKIIEELMTILSLLFKGTGELLGSMYKSVSNLDVKNVKIINKILTRAEVAEQLSEADVLILPLAPFFKSGSPYRGMSSKLYEYQAVGKPIICCSKGVPSIYIKETYSGLVVNPGDSVALAKAVLELKQNPSLSLKILGDNGRKYVESQVSTNAIGLTMKKIFKGLILN